MASDNEDDRLTGKSRARRPRKPTTIDLTAEHVAETPPASPDPDPAAFDAAPQAEPAYTATDAPDAGWDPPPEVESEPLPPDVPYEEPPPGFVDEQPAAATREPPPVSPPRAAPSEPLDWRRNAPLLVASAAAGAIIVLLGGLIFGGIGAGSSPDTTELVDRIAELDARVVALTAAPAPEPAVPPELTARIEGVETAVAGLTGNDAVAALEENVSALDARLAPLEGTPDALSSLQASVTTLSADLAARPAIDPTRLDAIETRLDALAASVGGSENALGALADVPAQLAAIEERLSAAEDALAAAPEEGRLAGLSLAASALIGAVTEGRPFATELAAARAAAPDLPGLAVLEPFAESGIRNAAELLESFPAAEIVGAVPLPEETSFADRAIAGAAALINLRTDEGGAGSPEATTRAIEAALAAGDVAAAAAAWQTLPEPARAAGADWGAALEARAAADTATSEINARVIELLSRQGAE
jgi:hypothetical protein